MTVTEPETRTLEVLQEDIDAGGRTVYNCPFALAARRLFPEWASVTVTPDDVLCARGSGHEYESGLWNLDAAGGAAVRRYDEGESMEPGAYTLTLAGRRSQP
jgi:hypothetical protein